ncbi:Sugar (and other) transporter [Phytophthora infestans]|uniref:Sugar (And other) transporter n=1 Tax=Phytophthora infestans TaxID=4787 RepID=A0A833WF08_PHYIN|nr:Sugar (and other) transporter [Phytophthora infestans]
MFPTPIRSTCHGISAAAGKVGAAIGSFGFSIWVDNPSYGYSGAFYTFAAIAAVSIPLTWFCVFDNIKGIEEMDADFYLRLNEADDFTRESFNSLDKISDAASLNMIMTPDVYKKASTPSPNMLA